LLSGGGARHDDSYEIESRSPPRSALRPRPMDAVAIAAALANPWVNVAHPGNPQHVERLADYWAELFRNAR